jgi:hypothetical protein
LTTMRNIPVAACRSQSVDCRLTAVLKRQQSRHSSSAPPAHAGLRGFCCWLLLVQHCSCCWSVR